MDHQTLSYYASNAPEVAGRYEGVQSEVSKLFCEAFAQKGRVLDVGCGSGRDVALLREMEFDAYGLDGTSELVRTALDIHPELRGRIKVARLPWIECPFDGAFDGILCCAVLMHLNEDALKESVRAFRLVLRARGSVLISVPKARSDLDGSRRDKHGRLFNEYTSSHLMKIFSSEGFVQMNEWEQNDGMQRLGNRWMTQLYILSY